MYYNTDAFMDEIDRKWAIQEREKFLHKMERKLYAKERSWR
jgi:hypothetical protein